MTKEIRICENCGYENEVTSLECTECGYDLSFVIPTIKQENIKPHISGWSLVAVDNNEIFENNLDGKTIGREGELFSDYVNKSDYISRKHAKFNIENGNLYVTDASTNGTLINEVRIEKLNKTELKNEDVVTFADLKFIVKGE